MTTKEKAKELVDKYLLLAIDFPYNDAQDGQCIGSGYMLYNSAKQCALIAVEETLNTIIEIYETYEERKFWQEVKQEIEKL